MPALWCPRRQGEHRHQAVQPNQLTSPSNCCEDFNPVCCARALYAYAVTAELGWTKELRLICRLGDSEQPRALTLQDSSPASECAARTTCVTA